MSETLLLVNPRAGGGRTGRTFDLLRVRIEEALGPCDVAFTQEHGDGIRIAREACAEGRARVVAVGGDGTVHEAINGLVEGGGAPVLGIIGTGTGGDFTKTLGIEHKLERYLEVIRDGCDLRVDVGKLTYRDHDGMTRTRHFGNILSMGVSGLVDRYVATAPRWLGNTTAYAFSSLRALVKTPLVKLRWELTDGAGAAREETLETRLLCICNGQYFGSGMQIAPMAQPADGLFELLALGSRSRWALLRGMSQVYSGKHVHSPGLRHAQCTRVRVDLVEDGDVRNRFLLDVDGEPLGVLPIEVKLLPGAVAVRAPRGTA